MVDKDKARRPSGLGEYLRHQREHLGLSQRQLAARAGFHHSFLARLENGEVTDQPRPENLQRLADALGLEVSELLLYLGVAKPELPSVQVYFRRKLGVDAAEAEVLASLVADYREKHGREGNLRGGTNEATNNE